MAFDTTHGKSTLVFSGLEDGLWEVLNRKPERAREGWDRITLTLALQLTDLDMTDAYAGWGGVSWEARMEVMLTSEWPVGQHKPDLTGRWYVDQARIMKYVGPIAIAEVQLIGVAYNREEEIETPLTDYLGVIRVVQRSGNSVTQEFPSIYSSDIPAFDTGGHPINLTRSNPVLVYETIVHGPPRTWKVGDPMTSEYEPGDRYLSSGSFGEPPAGTPMTTVWTPQPPESNVDTTPYNPIYQYPNGYSLMGQEWVQLGTPSAVPVGAEESWDFPRFNNCLTMVRDTWVLRRAIEPGPEA